MKSFVYFVVFSVLFSACSNKKNYILPEKKSITQVVYASGKIYPINVYNVYSKLPGYISKIYVNVKDSVKLGQPLISIKSEVNEKNLEIAKNQYQLASINISKNSPVLKALNEEVESALTKYKLDSINFVRYQNLLKTNSTSQLQYDQAKSQFEISRHNYVKALSNLEKTKNQLQIEYENAKLQYEAQQSNLSEYTIVSAISGKVYDIIPKEGELVNSATLLMVIGDSKKFEVELNVDETDVSLIKENQKVIFETDVYKDTLFYGNIKTIYQRINPINKTCRVIASIDAKNFHFYSGMSVEANIIVAEKKDALVIPKNYLLNSEYVITSKKDTIKIKKGIEDLEYVEITEGINEKTEIIAP
jgi:multidrug efflux pump subunit AcrA (membrane-fusion protein)